MSANPDELCPASFRLDGETFRCTLPLEHVYLDASDHECHVYWPDEIVGKRHRPHLQPG